MLRRVPSEMWKVLPQRWKVDSTTLERDDSSGVLRPAGWTAGHSIEAGFVKKRWRGWLLRSGGVGLQQR